MYMEKSETHANQDSFNRLMKMRSEGNYRYNSSNDFVILSNVLSLLAQRREYARELNRENLIQEYENNIMEMIERLNKNICELLTL